MAQDFGGEIAEANAAFAEAGVGLEEGDVLVEGGVGLRQVVEGIGEERRLFLLGGVAATPAVNAHRTAVMNGLTQILVAQARLIHGVELESDPLAQVAPAFVVGGTAEAIMAFVNGTAAVTVDELISELTTLWLVVGDGAAAVARARVTGDKDPG